MWQNADVCLQQVRGKGDVAQVVKVEAKRCEKKTGQGCTLPKSRDFRPPFPMRNVVPNRCWFHEEFIARTLNHTIWNNDVSPLVADVKFLPWLRTIPVKAQKVSKIDRYSFISRTKQLLSIKCHVYNIEMRVFGRTLL